MDFTLQYCPTRRDLEEHCWSLVNRLCGTTTALMKSIGGNRQLFLSTQSECQHTRQELSDSHHKLAAHRIAHGC